MRATGRVVFVGAGPGAADLITVRGARRIAEADLVLWPAGSVSPDSVREHVRPGAELIDSSGWSHEQALTVYRRAAASRLTVAVLHAGDPMSGGELARQHDACRRLGMQVEIVPGVSAFSAAAAAAGRELAGTAPAGPVVVARTDCGRLRLPPLGGPDRLDCTTAVVASAARVGQLVEELRSGGYPDDTPVVVAYKVSWPDELVLRTTLGELECTVKNHRLWRQTVFLVGRALDARQPVAAGENDRARPYHAGRVRGYRRVDTARGVARSQAGRQRRSRRTS